jgi:hypothetical protein
MGYSPDSSEAQEGIERTTPPERLPTEHRAIALFTNVIPLLCFRLTQARSHYSYRSATIGSIFVARCAGITQAPIATAPSTASVVTNVTGSLGVIP